MTEESSTWEERMAQRARERRFAQEQVEHPGEKPVDIGWPGHLVWVPAEMKAELPTGWPDEARDWCTMCGLADAPTWGKFDEPVPCPRCGSLWRWYGRLTDLRGTATGPPPGECLECFEWRRFPASQEHFGWGWWLICGHCDHAHHADEVWLAAPAGAPAS